MTPVLRKLGLVAHVTSSLSWLGAVASFFALGVAGLMTPDPQMMRAAYLAMDLITRLVIVPLAFASLLTGVVQSLGTPWGLFRHYWVSIKQALTSGATVVLLVHTRPIRYLAQAASVAMSGDDLRRLRIQVTADAALALVVLLVATILAVYKPRGLTRYGSRKQQAIEPVRAIRTTGP